MESSIMHALPSSDDSMVLAVPEPTAAAVTNLKLLYQLGASLGSSFSVDRVLEVVMDLVFEHLKADRGIILLIDEKKNELVPRIVRVRDENPPKKDGADGETKPAVPETIHASRTIIRSWPRKRPATKPSASSTLIALSKTTPTRRINCAC
jgi:GAF domain-containing protein